MRKNKCIIYLYSFTDNFVLYLALLPYLYSKIGLNLMEIATVTAVAHLVICILEIPTGVIADRVGKKFSVLLGTGFSILGLLVIIFSPKNYINILIWVIIQSFSVVLISGADRAMFFEYLKLNGKEHEFHKVISKVLFISRLSSFIATTLCGKVFGTKGFTYTLIITLCFKIASLIVLCFFKSNEVDGNIIKPANNKQEDYLGIIKDSFRTIINNKKLLYYFFFSGFLINLTGLIWEYKSLYVNFRLTSNSMKVSGIIAILTLVFSLGYYLSSICEKILARDKNHSIYLLLPIAVILASILPSYYGLLCYFLFVIIAGIFMPYMDYLMNINITNDNVRATVLSISSFFESLIYFIFSIMFGYISEKIGFLNSFKIIAILLIVIYCLLTIIVKVKGANNKNNVFS